MLDASIEVLQIYCSTTRKRDGSASIMALRRTVSGGVNSSEDGVEIRLVAVRSTTVLGIVQNQK